MMVLCLFLGGFLSPLYAQDPGAGERTFTEKACFACHGVGGLSQVDTYPVLAGKPEVYISGELYKFRSRERVNATMNAMAGGLSDKDILNIAAYLSSQAGSVKVAPSVDDTSMADDR